MFELLIMCQVIFNDQILTKLLMAVIHYAACDYVNHMPSMSVEMCIVIMGVKNASDS